MKRVVNKLAERTFWHKSLATRFVFLTVVVVFVIMGSSALLNYKQQKSTIIENIRSQSDMLGNFVASIAPETLLSYDFDALDEYMKDINSADGVVYAVIFSVEGEPITNHIKRNNPFVSNFIMENQEVDLAALVKRLRENESIIHQRFPILFQQKVVGYFNIGISKLHAEQVSRSILLGQLLVSALFIFLLGLGIYLVFRRYAMRPVIELLEGSRRITAGNLHESVKVYSKDELGHLAMSFNQMMKQLRRGIEEKDAILEQVRELNQTLETRVNMRTYELETANQQLEQLAMRDSLTNLPNRFCIQDRINQYIADVRDNLTPFCIVMMDLDRFKDINDTLGHDCGDQLLVELSLRLREILRPRDMVGRLGGDEFAIFLPETDEAGARRVAEKVVRKLEPAFHIHNMAFSIGASMGIARYPEHGETTSAILKAADIAMYHAKQRKLDYCFYHESLDRHTAGQLTLMGELRDAIYRNELQVYYQPKVDLTSQRIIGVEALVRWPHAQRGFVPPDEFIPIAEQTGLIRALTNHVIETVLLQCEQWHNAGITVSVSINLSVQNLQDSEFPRKLSTYLDRTSVANEFIQFEITESTIMTNPDYVQEVLRELGEHGISFAIDDFGTGYSSLSTLKKLPVQDLKIDKSFVIDMASNYDDEAIVHSIIDMAHNLGLNVVAEGVEDAIVTRQLMNLGCDMIQGYFISKPLPGDDMTEMLSNLHWDVTLGSSDHNLPPGVSAIKN